jgi:hypothetical protein
MAEIFSKDTPGTPDANSENPEKTVDNDAPSINDELLAEGFLPADFVEEIISELPPEPTTPPAIPHPVRPRIQDILGRSRVKSTSFVILLDPRRPGLVIDLEQDAYSRQNLNEKQYDYLDRDMRALIRLFVDIPFVAAVAETNWKNPPNFTFLYTIIADKGEKNSFNAIFADRAFFNKGLKFRNHSVELKNLPDTLTQDLIKTMDIADVEVLRDRIEKIIEKLLATDEDSEVYNSILTEMQELPEGMDKSIIELVNLVKKVELESGVEELCMVEFDYPTWEPKQFWNYGNPFKLYKRRKYRKLLQAILEDLKTHTPQNSSTEK